MRVSGWGVVGRGLVAATLAGVLAWWAMLVWGAEHFWWSAALQYAPYWGLLIPVTSVLLMSWALPWRWRLVALTALLIVIGPVMGLVIGRADEGVGSVRLMTYNIKAFLNVHEPGGLARVAWEIQRHNPDIVVMQDAGEAGAAVEPLNPQARQLIGDRQYYAFGQFIVASRLPMHDCASGYVSYFKQTHTYVHCVITAYGRDVDLVTIHLLSPRNGLNALRALHWQGRDEWEYSMKARLIQARALAEVLRQRKRPVILAGDFNAPERSMVVQSLIHAGLRDAFSAAGFGYGYTHGHSLWPGVSINRIDHILVSDEIGVAACEAGGKEGSEHRPVIADLLMHRD